MPWLPAPSVPQEDTGTKAEARHAAQRSLAQGRQEHQPHTCLVPAAWLRPHPPPLASLLAPHCIENGARSFQSPVPALYNSFFPTLKKQLTLANKHKR